MVLTESQTRECKGRRRADRLDRPWIYGADGRQLTPTRRKSPTKWWIKCASWRIFEDENGKTNCPLADVDGEIPLISQFTLYARLQPRKPPGLLRVREIRNWRTISTNIALARCAGQVRKVEHGIFGADMKVELLNDGPFTILLDSDTIVKKK
ncbi:MAG: D-aminoacyl-tRNA deacylase [Clostridium fessum]